VPLHLPSFLEVGLRSVGVESLPELLQWNSQPSVNQRELDLGVGELFDSGSQNVFASDGFDFDDLDASETGTMASSHVHVQLVNGPTTGQIPEFLVHIMCTGTTVVSAKNTKSLHLFWVFLVNLIDRENFTSRGLDLFHLV